MARAVVAVVIPSWTTIRLTFSEEEDDVLRALRAGARGYILKGVSGRELKGIVWAVYGGEVYITPTLAVLHDMAAGRSNKQIAAELELTEKTVKHSMTNILQKLQVRNRVEAALLAQKAARK